MEQVIKALYDLVVALCDAKAYDKAGVVLRGLRGTIDDGAMNRLFTYVDNAWKRDKTYY